MTELVRDIRMAETQMGSQNIQPSLSERSTMIDYRLWVIAEEDLYPGVMLNKSNYSIRKTSSSARGNFETRIRPSDVEQIGHRKLVRTVNAGEPILISDFE